MSSYEYIPGFGLFYKNSSMSLVDAVNRLNKIGNNNYTYSDRRTKGGKSGFTCNGNNISFSDVKNTLNEQEEL